MQPTAIVLHGPTSSGKSSLARALQASAPLPAFHISLDAFVTMANRADMRNDEEREQAYRIHCENLRATLAEVVDTRFDIILDLVLRDEREFDACLRVLAHRPTYSVRDRTGAAIIVQFPRTKSCIVTRSTASTGRCPSAHAKIRYLDKLIDELAKGRAMEKILR